MLRRWCDGHHNRSVLCMTEYPSRIFHIPLANKWHSKRAMQCRKTTSLVHSLQIWPPTVAVVVFFTGRYLQTFINPWYLLYQSVTCISLHTPKWCCWYSPLNRRRPSSGLFFTRPRSSLRSSRLVGQPLSPAPPAHPVPAVGLFEPLFSYKGRCTPADPSGFNSHPAPRCLAHTIEVVFLCRCIRNAINVATAIHTHSQT